MRLLRSWPCSTRWTRGYSCVGRWRAASGETGCWRTPLTNWSNIDKQAFSRLLENVASEALHLARTMVKKVHGPVLGELKKWGIKVVVWKPTAVTYGDLQSA